MVGEFFCGKEEVEVDEEADSEDNEVGFHARVVSSGGGSSFPSPPRLTSNLKSVITKSLFLVKTTVGFNVIEIEPSLFNQPVPISVLELSVLSRTLSLCVGFIAV